MDGDSVTMWISLIWNAIELWPWAMGKYNIIIIIIIYWDKALIQNYVWSVYC